MNGSLCWIRRLVLPALLLCSIPGAAAEVPLDARITAAVRAYSAGEYERSLQAFQAAYEERPFPRLLYNMGRVHQALGNSEEALRCYERFLREDTSLTAAEREKTEGYMALLRDRLRQQHAAPPSALLAQHQVSRKQERVPLYRRWWLWTGVGALTIGAVAVGVGLGRESQQGASPMIVVTF